MNPNMNLYYFWSLLISFILAYISIYLMYPRSVRLGFVDQPSVRKKHRAPISLVGGIGIFSGFFLSYFFLNGMNRFTYTLLTGSLALLATGLLDDWFKSKGQELSAWPKLLVQLAVGLSVYLAGYQIQGIRGAGIWEYYLFPNTISALATIIWIVAMINMMNFLDGLDGLAGGIGAISAGTLFLLALFRGQNDIALMSIILVGACLGFLRFNFYPAKVFMGDSGSQVLGFLLGMISLEGTLKSTTIATVVITVLALGVPIIDTIQVFISRLVRGQPLYRPDHLHVHHRLKRGGFKDWQVVSILYVVGIIFSVLSVALFFFWS